MLVTLQYPRNNIVDGILTVDDIAIMRSIYFSNIAANQENPKLNGYKVAQLNNLENLGLLRSYYGQYYPSPYLILCGAMISRDRTTFDELTRKVLKPRVGDPAYMLDSSDALKPRSFYQDHLFSDQFTTEFKVDLEVIQNGQRSTERHLGAENYAAADIALTEALTIELFKMKVRID